MPEVSRFFGISIKLYPRDHSPPHLHAEYGDFEATFNIQTFAIIRGKLPPRVTGFVVEWMSLHQVELLDAWETMRRGQSPESIRPLE